MQLKIKYCFFIITCLTSLACRKLGIWLNRETCKCHILNNNRTGITDLHLISIFKNSHFEQTPISICHFHSEQFFAVHSKTRKPATKQTFLTKHSHIHRSKLANSVVSVAIFWFLGVVFLNFCSSVQQLLLPPYTLNREPKRATPHAETMKKKKLRAKF